MGIFWHVGSSSLGGRIGDSFCGFLRGCCRSSVFHGCSGRSFLCGLLGFCLSRSFCRLLGLLQGLGKLVLLADICLRFGLDVRSYNRSAGQQRAGVLALFADGQRQLIVRHNDATCLDAGHQPDGQERLPGTTPRRQIPPDFPTRRRYPSFRPAAPRRRRRHGRPGGRPKRRPGRYSLLWRVRPALSGSQPPGPWP